MAGLWIAYLVPHHLRYRQQLLDARVEDRFSEHLRILAVLGEAGPGPGSTSAGGSPAVRAEPLRLHPVRNDQRERRGGSPMKRPHGTTDRVAADLVRRSAAEHSQRAAHLARRAAGARRRALLTLLLVVATPAAWGVVAFASVPLVAGVVPSALLLAVLVAGRRAVVAAARADEQWRAGEPYRLPAPRRAPSAVGRAVRPSEAVTEIMARVPRVPVQAGASVALAEAAAAVASATPAQDRAERRAATARRSAADEATSGPAWMPVPVPRPTYTLKPEARRGEPAPLPAPLPAPRSAEDAAADVTADETAPAAPVAAAPARPAGLDLDAVLARRRASGE